MKRTLIAMGIFASLLAGQQTRGQTIKPGTFNAAGGSSTISGSTYSYSIGEMAIVGTASGSNVIVTQGVLQPFDGPEGVATVSSINNLQVYPNPASAVVYLQYAAQANGTLTYRLLDVAGKTVISNSVKTHTGSNTEQINVSGLANANYVLQVTVNNESNNTQTTSYKIQKIK